MRLLLRILLWAASVGWLLPTYLAITFYFGYQREDIQAYAYHGSPAVCSFPFLAESQKMFDIAFPWFACVFGFWTAVAVRAVTKRKCDAEKKPEKK